MTSDNEPTLMGRDYLDITEHRDPERVVKWLREANEYFTAQNSNDIGGTVWSFMVGPEQPGLKVMRFGVRGDRGWVEWYHGQENLIPAEGGLNEDWVDYWTWFSYEAGSAPPGSELPFDQVCDLLAEFVRTAERPTSIEWQQPPSEEEEERSKWITDMSLAVNPPRDINEPILLGRRYFDIVRHNDPDQVVALLREANGLHDRMVQERGRDGGMKWEFRVGEWEPGVETLQVGVRGEWGSMEWSRGDEVLIPADGVNDDWEKYWSWLGFELWAAAPGTEFPIDRIYDLVAEFVRTAQRPTSITWRPVDKAAAQEWYELNNNEGEA